MSCINAVRPFIHIQRLVYCSLRQRIYFYSVHFHTLNYLMRTKKPPTKTPEALISMAESEGFEPSVQFPAHTLSRRAPSTTRTTLQMLSTIQFSIGNDI